MALVDQDQEHLRLLTVFHYVYAGMVALFACFPIIHLVVGILMLTKPDTFSGPNNPPPALIGYLFAIMGGAFVVGGWMLAICTFLVGRFLASRRHYVFCLIISGVNCIVVPLGTVLGVVTIMVLLRPTVKTLFSTPVPAAVPMS